ncbi:hypothetical protein KPL47_22545 [Clostridium estertheticum]|uniref:hypothetical protein n=1 Tax=Clostridium estertheticum TaxID=238834 RepID=UPI001C0D9E6E|nr:hypothetical protein [Clostridium estertheticum]MBU3179079.1 hypothetical protein [Clostridium estertheticum]
MPRMAVSFRETVRDLTIFNEVQNKEKLEKSEFVKDALEFYIAYLKQEKTKEQ